MPPAQTQLMAEALNRMGIPQRYLTFQGEGHGLRRPSSIKRALEAELSLYLDAVTCAQRNTQRDEWQPRSGSRLVVGA